MRQNCCPPHLFRQLGYKEGAEQPRSKVVFDDEWPMSFYIKYSVDRFVKTEIGLSVPSTSDR